MEDIRAELDEKIGNLVDWELLPVLALVDRLLDGKAKYGEGLKTDRDWLKEAAEEAGDLWNYYWWKRYHDRTSGGYKQL